MVEIDYWFDGIRFVLGFVGTLTYFMCVKYNFLNFDFDNPEKNSNAIPNNKYALAFFCLIGGLIPIMMDIRLNLGCFVQGFILRATLSSFYSAAKERTNETSKEGLER